MEYYKQTGQHTVDMAVTLDMKQQFHNHFNQIHRTWKNGENPGFLVL